MVEEEGFIVDGGYGAEHREGDGWLERLGMWRLSRGMCLHLSTFEVPRKEIEANDLLHFVGF